MRFDWTDDLRRRIEIVEDENRVNQIVYTAFILRFVCERGLQYFPLYIVYY